MRFERLVIGAGTNSFTLDLHQRLTVIAGLGRLERESLLGELVGAMGSSRSNVHLEIVQDTGRRLAVFRPEGARQRVVDVDLATDVSREFMTSDGRIDMLAHDGLDLRTARRRMRLTANDLTTSTQGGHFIRQLAGVEPNLLWAAADAVHATDDRLQSEAESLGSAPEDAEVVERIEKRHSDFEAAQGKHERARQQAMLVSAICAIAAVPATLFMPTVSLLLLTVTCVAVLLSIIQRKRMQTAEREEQEALADAGAQSYLGFHLQRVNGLLSSGQSRRRLMGAADAHRRAVADWEALTGEIPVEFAIEHREEILAAARLRKDVTTLGTLSSTAPEVDSDATTDLARALVARLTELRKLGASGESFPLVLDEPFVGLEPSVKPSLLELLGRSSGNPQIIFLTEDEDVASWARLEALTGELAILEPTPDRETSKARQAGDLVIS